MAKYGNLKNDIITELQHDNTNKMTGAPSEDSYQPGHPPSLIRGYTVHMKFITGNFVAFGM